MGEPHDAEAAGPEAAHEAVAAEDEPSPARRGAARASGRLRGLLRRSSAVLTASSVRTAGGLPSCGDAELQRGAPGRRAGHTAHRRIR